MAWQLPCKEQMASSILATSLRLIGRNGATPSWYEGDGWFDSGIRLMLTAWAQTWFLALIMLVVVTIAVLFILALLEIARINRKL